MDTQTQERNYYLGFARASLEGLLGVLEDDLTKALLESWVPGAAITRYNRRWHLTKVLEQTADVVYGKIGFVTEDELETLRFDPDLNDFTYGEAPSGVVVPFVFRKADGLVVYQMRPGIVRETTFTGALQELLSSTSLHLWSVESYVESLDYSDWLREIDVLTRFDFTLDRPNPHYGPRRLIEQLIEGTGSEGMRLVANAPEGRALDTSSDLIEQAIDHVEHNYGKAKLTGRTPDGEERVWVKLRGMAASRFLRVKRRRVGDVEASSDLLTETMNDPDATTGLALTTWNADKRDG